MTTTVAIPAEIVGDTETLRHRKAVAEISIVNWARTLVDVPNHEGSAPYCVRQIAEHVERLGPIDAEILRRNAAYRMARAIQPEGTAWR